jgi:hypothetical protein
MAANAFTPLPGWRKIMSNERELTEAELDAVSGGGTNGGTVAAGWDTKMSGGPVGSGGVVLLVHEPIHAK